MWQAGEGFIHSTEKFNATYPDKKNIFQGFREAAENAAENEGLYFEFNWQKATKDSMIYEVI